MKLCVTALVLCSVFQVLPLAKTSSFSGCGFLPGGSIGVARLPPVSKASTHTCSMHDQAVGQLSMDLDESRGRSELKVVARRGTQYLRCGIIPNTAVRPLRKGTVILQMERGFVRSRTCLPLRMSVEDIGEEQKEIYKAEAKKIESVSCIWPVSLPLHPCSSVSVIVLTVLPFFPDDACLSVRVFLCILRLHQCLLTFS